jgi:hypothetical protein
MATPNEIPAPTKPLMAGCQQEPCSVVERVTAMAWDKLAILEAIEATHPCRMETPESYQADALAMELIHKRHDKREIVNLIRWCLMGCPPNTTMSGIAGDATPTQK